MWFLSATKLFYLDLLVAPGHLSCAFDDIFLTIYSEKYFSSFEKSIEGKPDLIFLFFQVAHS